MPSSHTALGGRFRGGFAEPRDGTRRAGKGAPRSPAIALPRCITLTQKGVCSLKDLCQEAHSSVVFGLAPNWKEPQRPPVQLSGGICI